MLNRQELINYRQLRGVTPKEVAQFCNITETFIKMIESGDRGYSDESYREFVKGINLAYQAKKRGELNKVKAVRITKTTPKKKANEAK